LYSHYARPDLAHNDLPDVKTRREMQTNLWEKKGLHFSSIVQSIEKSPAFRNNISNMQCEYLSSGPATFDAALKTMREKDCIVGLFERLDLFNGALAKLLHWKDIEMQLLNRSQTGSHETILEERGAVEALTELNEEDLKLYRFIREECGGLFSNLPNRRFLEESTLSMNTVHSGPNISSGQ
jgi:hypothetical protein